MPAIYPATSHDATFYIYNNRVYGSQGQNMSVEIDPEGATGTAISAFVLNNTFVMPNGVGSAIRCVPRGEIARVRALTIINNHVLGSNVAVHSECPVVTEAHNLLQAPTIAAAQGYTLAACTPLWPEGATIDSGTNLSAYLGTDILGAPRPLGSAWDVGAYEWRGDMRSAPEKPSGVRVVR